MKVYQNKQKVFQDVWIKAWCDVARSDNCTSMDSPTKWADTCLEDFKKRFEQDMEKC